MEFRGSYPRELYAMLHRSVLSCYLFLFTLPFSGSYYHYSSQCCVGWVNNCVSSSGTAYTSTIDQTLAYHNYTFEWWPTNMTWYAYYILLFFIFSYFRILCKNLILILLFRSVDGSVYQTVRSSSLANGLSFDASPKYIIFNSAVGGSYPGNPDSNTVFPNNLHILVLIYLFCSYLFDYHELIDSVRVWVYRESCNGVTCNNHGCCDLTTIICNCDAGWAGKDCDYYLGIIIHDDATFLIDSPFRLVC